MHNCFIAAHLLIIFYYYIYVGHEEEDDMPNFFTMTKIVATVGPASDPPGSIEQVSILLHLFG